jgi:polysaccharide deacetylase 2 family uncharacterized protein YibQ
MKSPRRKFKRKTTNKQNKQNNNIIFSNKPNNRCIIFDDDCDYTEIIKNLEKLIEIAKKIK